MPQSLVAKPLNTTAPARTRHMKMVQYLPPNGAPSACAAIWGQDGYVHLTSPLAHTHGGVVDPWPYVRMFPEVVASIDAFEETMTWLDAACYAATDPRQVEAACRENPEWRLQCVRYDGSDTTLLGLGRLIRAAVGLKSIPQAVMREHLLGLIQQILKSEPGLSGAHISSTVTDGNAVATLDLGFDNTVRVSLRTDILSAEQLSDINAEQYRTSEVKQDGVHNLLVLAQLEMAHPVVMASQLVVTDLNPANVRAALVRMRRC